MLNAIFRKIHSCVFLPGHCAFFVKYVITAALTGSALELLRFSELFMYCLKILFARSAAEKSAIRKVAFSFAFLNIYIVNAVYQFQKINNDISLLFNDRWQCMNFIIASTMLGWCAYLLLSYLTVFYHLWWFHVVNIKLCM